MDGQFGSNQEKDNGNLLSGISLACFIVGLLLIWIPNSINLMASAEAHAIKNDASVWSSVQLLLGAFGHLLKLVAYVVLIIARVKYPRNLFGKVLMWIYIILFVIEVILLIIMAAMLVVGCVACFSCLKDIPG